MDSDAPNRLQQDTTSRSYSGTNVLDAMKRKRKIPFENWDPEVLNALPRQYASVCASNVVSILKSAAAKEAEGKSRATTNCFNGAAKKTQKKQTTQVAQQDTKKESNTNYDDEIEKQTTNKAKKPAAVKETRTVRHEFLPECGAPIVPVRCGIGRVSFPRPGTVVVTNDQLREEEMSLVAQSVVFSRPRRCWDDAEGALLRCSTCDTVFKSVGTAVFVAEVWLPLCDSCSSAWNFIDGR